MPSSALLEATLDLPQAEPEFPADWPAPGPIDLNVQDRPHASSSLEWWYLNCHVHTASGRELSLFAAFFRQLVGRDPATGEASYAHSVSWALSDPVAKRFSCKVAVDAAAPALGLAKLDAGAGVRDQRLNRALREVLERGAVPSPTLMFESEAHVDAHELNLEFGGDSLKKLPNGSYELQLFDELKQSACQLNFVPRKAPLRYARDGVVHGVADELMFYYFIPRCDVTGFVVVDGQCEALHAGSGWYDHEFGFAPKPSSLLRAVNENDAPQTSWRWVSLQLDNGVDVSVFIITRGDRVLDNWAVISGADGRRRVFQDVQLSTLETWQSTRSFVEYPVRWQLDVPVAGLKLEIRAPFYDQEVLTIISDPGFWEGRVDAQGVVDEEPVVGRGWVETKGARFNSIEGFFGAVGKQVRQRIADIMPLQPTSEQIQQWLVRGGTKAGRDAAGSGVDAQLLADNLARPIRDITDRGGKSWRSYAALACIDVVGGDSREFLHWLPIPELLHVGSLIVDDVEDDSIIRRGGATSHLVHGRPRAINAGTAAYFLAEPPMLGDQIKPEDKVTIYGFYFDALRAGHAGQALDLAGCKAEAARAVGDGDITRLESQVLAIHRLKTAVPAAMLARIGAVLGGGTKAQVEGLGAFFEALGLAFQIMDDVLNLRGFENNLKERGEDVRQGKITLPIVKALGRMPLSDRNWLWHALHSEAHTETSVQYIIDILESTGAIDDCVSMARAQVQAAWDEVDGLLVDSQFKIMFRAFADFVLERHY